MAMALVLVACHEEQGFEVEQPVPTVTAQLNFSLPVTIGAATRMTADVVQEDGTFRGISDIHLLCFDQNPSSTTRLLGDVLSIKPTMDTLISRTVKIPVNTSYIALYTRAKDNPQTHAERMHYGAVEMVGVERNDYTTNADMRFRPVPICTSSDPLGGSARGRALLALLNDIVSTTADDAAPNNRLSTSDNIYLQQAYQALTQLQTLSSQNVEIMLGNINKMVNQEQFGTNGRKLADAITAKIAAACATTPGIHDRDITLKAELQGYPADVNLPIGAARMQWNAGEGKLEPASSQNYGNGMSILSVNDFVYPMSLQYHVCSEIVATDSLVLEEALADPDKYDSWTKVIDSAYVDGTNRVKYTTQSVAMVKQAEYAVGRLSLRARISRDELYDANGKWVDVSKGFTLKGFIVGGQREADFKYEPISGSHEYAIYDTDLQPGTTNIIRRNWSDSDPMNYILGLETEADHNVYIALELVNNGPDFQGADGTIYHGTTFYLVADMVPSTGENYNSYLNQIFSKDKNTTVSLTVSAGWPDKDGDGVPDPDLDEHGNPKPMCGLGTATYGMPRLDVPQEVGLSVDLSWGEGLFYEDIEL